MYTVFILVDEYDKPIHYFLRNLLTIKKQQKQKEAKELTKIETLISEMIGNEAKVETKM